MKCDQCDNEATVHEWTKKAGQKVEKHLCEECARKQGVAIHPQQQISQLITQLIGNPKTGTLTTTVQVGACPTCGTTYAQFRHSGLLGCPRCYSTFEAQLGPLLQRAHEGGTHHTGKCPAAPPPVDPELARLQAEAAQRGHAERLQRLRDQLTEAVAAEQYEKAAALRDELGELERRTGSGGLGNAGPGAPGGAKGAAGGSAPS